MINNRERKLVTVRKIDKILPIEGKDLIALAMVDGWSIIVKKTEFKAGDLCVFFEIDCFIPASDTRFSFLKPINYNGIDGYRIKTMKMAGCLSQGLALPYSMFPELPDIDYVSYGAEKSCDYADKLQIVKYDLEFLTTRSQSGVKSESSFPSFIPKTDENRIQNITHAFDTYKDMEFEETLKLDGSSMTVYKLAINLPWYKKVLNACGMNFPKEVVGVCSRNLTLKEPEAGDTDNNYWKAVQKFSLKSKVPTGFALQGELLAPNIQSNHEKVTDVEYRVYKVWDITKQEYLTPHAAKYLCDIQGLNYVPVVNSAIKIFQQCPTLESLLSRVDSSSMNLSVISEGRVYQSIDNPSLSFKVINNKYLLKCEQ